MAISIVSPKFSFVRFSPEVHPTCTGPDVHFHIPMYLYNDIAFQFFVNTDTKVEADALFDLANNRVSMAITADCNGPSLLDYLAVMGLKPQRRRAGEKQVLYHWPHGFPLFDAHVPLYGCFFAKITITHPTAGTITACSNAFQRIPEDCYTAVVEYGSEQNIFDFNYCGAGTIDAGVPAEPMEPPMQCEPIIYQFTNVATIDYFYSEEMRQKYGDVPSVDIWILDEATNRYVKPVIRHGFNTYPPSRILADLGGVASGFMKIS